MWSPPRGRHSCNCAEAPAGGLRCLSSCSACLLSVCAQVHLFFRCPHHRGWRRGRSSICLGGLSFWSPLFSLVESHSKRRCVAATATANFEFCVRFSRKAKPFVALCCPWPCSHLFLQLPCFQRSSASCNTQETKQDINRIKLAFYLRRCET